MNNTWLIILGALAAGFAVFLLLPYVLPEKESMPEIPALVDVEPDVAEAEQPAVIEPETVEEETETDATTEPEFALEEEPVLPTGYVIDGAIGATEYAHSTEVVGIEVYWANDATYLRVGLVAPGTGYVAIGFDPVRQMECANFIVGYV